MCVYLFLYRTLILICASNILIINTEFRVQLAPFLEEHVPFDKGLTPAICSRMAVLVSRHDRVTFITFLLP